MIPVYKAAMTTKNVSSASAYSGLDIPFLALMLMISPTYITLSIYVYINTHIYIYAFISISMYILGIKRETL